MGGNENRMPVGRVILKSISESKKLPKLKTDGARLLYTWLLTHLDVNGCYSGDAQVINGKVFTRLNKSNKTIEGYLKDLEENQLIIRYEINGDIFLHVPDFVEKQPFLNPKREGKPTIPVPPPDILQSKSGVNPLKVKVKDKVNIKDNNSSDLRHKSEPKLEIIFNFSTKEWENITEEDKKIWKEAYPACDIEQELKKMKAWVLSAGAKGHKKNWVKFITNWLSRSQDNGGTTRGKSSDWKTT